MSMQKLAILLVCAALITGCARKTKPDDEAADAAGRRGGEVVTQPSDDDDLFGDGRAVEGELDVTDTPQALVDQTIIYFDFDSASIRSEYAQAIASHAAHLVDNARMAVRLEGHTDERGSREYNIGLGERRAQAVRRALMLQGVSGDQISTVSLGEERPAVTGGDEEAWAMNRRVEIVYLR